MVYGMSRQMYRPVGCFLGGFLIIVSMFLSGIPTGVLAQWLTGGWLFLVWLASTIAITIGFFKLNRKMSTYSEYWCPHCGIPSHPGFPTCQQCGRDKGHQIIFQPKKKTPRPKTPKTPPLAPADVPSAKPAPNQPRDPFTS